MIFSNENWNSNKSYHLGSSADIYKCYLYWSSTWFTCIVKMTQLHRKIIALLFLVWYKTIPIFALLLQLCICGVDVSFKPAKYAKWIWNWWKIKLKKILNFTYRLFLQINRSRKMSLTIFLISWREMMMTLKK